MLGLFVALEIVFKIAGSHVEDKMLKLDSVSYVIEDEKILGDISFEAVDGELLCLLGPSGSGKTSTLRLIAGLAKLETGTIYVNGKTVSSRSITIPPHKRDIGFLFQDFALFPHLTVTQNIRYGLAGLEKHKAIPRTQELLEQIRLTTHAHKYPHTLSGGEQQRVALARAVASRPRLLLLDEPFSNLDTSLREQVREETVEITKNHGVTTVMVTHDPDEAMSVADRIVLINNGKVVQIDTPERLYNNPVDEFSAGFFGNINRVTGTVVEKEIKTKIGNIPSAGLKNGSVVDVFIRPDGVKLLPPEKRPHNSKDEAWVCGVRYRGNSSLIRVGIGCWPEPHTHLEANHPHTIPMKTGDRLALKLDHSKTFVFKNKSEP